MPPKQTKSKDLTATLPLFPSSVSCTLPVWDDAQIQQENWGASLSAAATKTHATAAVTAKEPVKGSAKGGAKDGPSGGCYTDLEGRALIATVLDGAENGRSAAKDESAGVAASQEIAAAKCRFSWQRPADVVQPFRPVVHRNTTPFLHPYADDLHRQPTRRKDVAAEVKPLIAPTKPTGRKSEAHKEAEPEVPHHDEYPETITLVDDLVGQGNISWDTMSGEEAIKRYRAMAPLMQPYNPTLLAGCAETPAEAIGSRYSTALRHKLKAAEALAALDEVPPFFMSGFNSVLLLVHEAQYLVEEGNYLWELVYPHAPGTCHPVYNPHGKYAVKLFVDGAYRKVLVDDALPVDELGRPMLTVTSRKELWPALLAKAIVKVCGRAAKSVLLESPEIVISMLLGNWVPRYVQNPKDTVDTASLCVQYQQQLSTPPNPPAPEPPRLGQPDRGRGSGQKETTVKRSKSSSSRPPSNSSARADSVSSKGPKQSNGRPSSSSLRSQAGATDAFDPSAASAETLCDKSLPMLFCALRRTPSEAASTHPGIGNGVQLYAIASIVPFRNTFALGVRTAPKTDLAEGVFARERDRPDVHEVIHAFEAKHHATASSVHVGADEGDLLCWLTLEEFCAAMDSLVVWQSVTGRYANHVFVESLCPATDAHPAAAVTAAPTGKKGQAAQQHAQAPPASDAKDAGSARKEAVRWVKITCTVPSEFAVIASRCVNPSAMADDGAPTATSDAVDHTADVTEGYSEAEQFGSSHPMELSYYVWDRCDPLTTALRTVYFTGKVSSTVLRLVPGVHLYRLRLCSAAASDRLVLASNAEIELLTESPELGKSSAFAVLTDADRRVPILKPDEEYLWFKRKFKVTEPTRLTLLLESLPNTEDVSRHRILPMATGKPAGKQGGGKPSAPPGGSGGANRRSSGASAACVGHAAADNGVMQATPVLRYTKLMLVNLDNRQEMVFGEAGRLPQLLLQPNAKGYYITAFTHIPSDDAAFVASRAASNDGEVGRDAPLPLYHAGQWKLIARSDHELQHFEALPLGANTLSSRGTLARGGTRLLFRYTCAVTESTHVTVAADVQTRVPGCQFELRITRSGRPGTPSSGLGTGGTSTPAANATGSTVRGDRGSNMHSGAHGSSHNNSSARPGTSDSTQSKDVEECVFESGWQASHLFLPDFLLEPVEKSKGTTYLIEGRVPQEFATAWDEQCRYAQEQRFLNFREDAAKKAAARLDEERHLALEDPVAFMHRKQDEMAYQQQQQLLLEQAEKSSRENRSRKKRGSIQATAPATAMTSNAANSDHGNVGSISSDLDSAAQQLDVVDNELEVQYHIFLDVSSSKTEVKPALPVTSGLTALRQQWGSTLLFLKALATPADAQNAGTQPSPPQSSRGTAPSSRVGGGRPHQKDSVPTLGDEASQRAHLASQRARHEFLTNPFNLFFPRLEESPEKEPSSGKREKTSAGAAAARQNASTDSHSACPTNSVIVVDETEDTNFRHAPCLVPSEYKQQLLPMWSFEVSECTSTNDSPVPDKPPLTGSGKRAKPSKEARLSAATSGVPGAATSAAANAQSATAVYPSASSPIQARFKEEQEKAYASARAPLLSQIADTVEAYKESRENQQKHRRMVRDMVATYWTDRYATPPMSVAESSRSIGADAATGASALHFTSLLGRTKEENEMSTLARRQRSVSPAA